jgi:hypothetical protein
MNQVLDTSMSLYLNGAARIYQCHSYTDRFLLSLSRYFAISHQITYFAFPLPAPWTLGIALQMPGFRWYVSRRRWANRSPTTLPLFGWSKTIQTRVSESSCSMLSPFLYHTWTYIAPITYRETSRWCHELFQAIPSGVVGNVAHLWVALLPISSHHDVLYGFTAWPRP